MVYSSANGRHHSLDKRSIGLRKNTSSAAKALYLKHSSLAYPQTSPRTLRTQN